jgi:hypothetical protein
MVLSTCAVGHVLAVLNARKLLEKGTRCCAAINKAIAGYQTAKGQGVFDGGNSDVDVKGANQNEAMTKSKALTMLADGLAALVDCELNVKSNRVEVSATLNQFHVTASMLHLTAYAASMTADMRRQLSVCV